jgi:hypothetical protein
MLASAAIAVPAALGVSPHFINASATVNNDGTLTANFKEAGLGSNQLINYTLSADGTATWVCVNKAAATPAPRTRRRSTAR